MRVAIVHDWFVTYAGSERVVEQLIALFPQADVFSLLDFLPASDRRMLAGKKIETSFLQRMPWAAQVFGILAADAVGHRADESFALRHGHLQ